MDDGLDGAEALVFGLGTGETATLVVALLAAWACIAALPAPVAWPLAAGLAGSGALLGWGRRDERTLLAWAVLAARFGWRRRAEAAAQVRRAVSSLAARRPARRRLAWPHLESGDRRWLPVPAPAVVLPLVLPRPGGRPSRVEARLVGIFSLRGGSGRTALACALAARLAGAGRLPGHRGWRPLRVALLDLDSAVPAASLRWGARVGGPPRQHESGAVIHPGAVADGGELLDAVGRGADGVDVAIVDARWHEPQAAEALRVCDDIVVLVEPTPEGWLDTYRSVAWLRGAGLGDRLLLVGNRCRDDADVSELEGDLGLTLVVRVPVSEDLEGESAVAALAALLNQRALGERAGTAVNAAAG